MQDSLSLDELDRPQLEAFEGQSDTSIPARVVAEHKDRFDVITPTGPNQARITGTALRERSKPAVGDFVALESRDGSLLIRAVLPRRSVLSRKVPGEATVEQILATNVDVVAIVEPLDAGPNLRRIERYLTAIWESGARPVVLLTKSDVDDDAPSAVSAVAAIAPGADVWSLSVVTGDGFDSLRSLDRAGTTLVMLGRSGAGKSTLINRLLGEEAMSTGEVRKDGRGRHTTTLRRMLRLPGGGSIIDTPGIRELQLWSDGAAATATFQDLDELARGCRFNDCLHDTEPGCRVLEAVADGDLALARLESWRKQRREVAALERRLDKRRAREEERRWGKMAKEASTRSRRR